MRLASRGNGRSLRIETLETRALMSAVPSTAVGASALHYTVTAGGDMVVPIHAQVGSTALEVVLGVTTTINSIEDALNAYLNAVPGWHLTGGVDKTPSYAGMIDGSIVIGANGMLKSANVALSASADIAGAVEGYYGVSILHVGVGAAVGVAANVSAAASYTLDTNTWTFGGSASLVGYAKGYASAMAWPLKGEVYIRGDLQANAAISSDTGIASASIVAVGSVGADAQMKSLFGGWTTIASASRSLGSWQYTTSYDVGSWLQSQVKGVAAVNQAARVSAIVALAAEAKTSALDVSTSSATNSTAANQVGTIDVDPEALVAEVRVSAIGVRAPSSVGSVAAASLTARVDPGTSRLAASVHAAALEQLTLANPLAAGAWAA
jgi:hypothetical protein